MNKLKLDGWTGQVLAAVVIALVVGSSAPWWWQSIFRHDDSHKRHSVPSTPPGGASSSDSSSQLSDDFPGGSKSVFSADFSTWPQKQDQEGSIGLGFGNSLLLQPTGNTIIVSSQPSAISGLDGDFVIDWNFRIDERHPSAALYVSIAGSGPSAPEVSLVLDVWDQGNADYSVTESILRSGSGLAVTYDVPVASIADRKKLPGEIANHDWSQPSKLTLMRVGGKMRLFVNGVFVQEFVEDVFSVTSLTVEAALKSKIEVTAIEARVKI